MQPGAEHLEAGVLNRLPGLRQLTKHHADVVADARLQLYLLGEDLGGDPIGERRRDRVEGGLACRQRLVSPIDEQQLLLDADGKWWRGAEAMRMKIGRIGGFRR